MIGVLIASDPQGRQYLLRGVSGSFGGGSDAAHGAPNQYWSRRLIDYWRIGSATNGVFSYNAYNGQETQFGKCAATHVLSNALHLRLQIHSMAEMWIGVTMNNRDDGQLQASCDFCRRYFEHMLCDRGGQPPSDPYVGAANTAPNRGLLIRIREEPSVAIPHAPVTDITLHGNPVPGGVGGETYTWNSAGLGVAGYRGRTDQPDLDLRGGNMGSSVVTLQYSANGMTKDATVTVHVVGLTFQEVAPVTFPSTQAAGAQIHALASHAAVGYGWAITGTAGVIRFAGATNAATVTVQPAGGAGVAQVEASCTILGVPVRQMIQVRVT